MPRCPSHAIEFFFLKSPSQQSPENKTNIFFLFFPIIPPNSPAYMCIEMFCQRLISDPSVFSFLFSLASKLTEVSMKYHIHPICRHSPLESKILMSLAGQSLNHDYHGWHAAGRHRVLIPCPLLGLSEGHMLKTSSFFPEPHWPVYHWRY